MTSASRHASGYLLLAAFATATAVVYVGLVPRRIVAGDESRALLYLVVGWVPYTITFYAIGRLLSDRVRLPNTRPIDAGLGLVLVSLLLSLGLDAWGFSPERVPAAHAVQAVGVFVGFALLGWGIGHRSRALGRTDGRD